MGEKENRFIFIVGIGDFQNAAKGLGTVPDDSVQRCAGHHHRNDIGNAIGKICLGRVYDLHKVEFVVVLWPRIKRIDCRLAFDSAHEETPDVLVLSTTIGKIDGDNGPAENEIVSVTSLEDRITESAAP